MSLGLPADWEMGGPKAFTTSLSLADRDSLETSRGPVFVCDGLTESSSGDKMVLTVVERRCLSMNALGNRVARSSGDMLLGLNFKGDFSNFTSNGCVFFFFFYSVLINLTRECLGMLNIGVKR